MPVSGSGHEDLTSPLPLQYNRVVLVMDLVESVRLMAANESAVVNHWRGFLSHARTQVLPQRRGRLVKSLGDGILAEFDQPVDAVQAAHELHRFFAPLNQTLPPAEQLHLRAGINASHLYVDSEDVYGHGVNLAARVTSLADPGDTVVTAAVRDAIVDGVDGEVEDMGDSYLKHWPEPVRTWRVHPAHTRPAVWRPDPRDPAPADFRQSIAVIPFEARNPSPEHFVIGELIADGVIAQLSRSQDLRVISRLSTTAFRGRHASPTEIDARLDAAFVLFGGYSTLGDKVVVTAELTDTRRNEVVWAERLSGDILDLMQVQSELINNLSAACTDALLHCELQRTLVLPLPKLDSNALMLGGITLMHRSTPRDLLRSRELLEAVSERHKRVASPWAWLAKWHIMEVSQGLSADATQSFRHAISSADRALDLEPTSTLAMAIKGHALCHLGADIHASRRLLIDATQTNPNNPMAWLYAGFWSSMWGEAQEAVANSERALALSPLDPHQFYLQMLASNSYLANGQLDMVIRVCNASLRKNRYHAPTLRALMVAMHESGQENEARDVFQLICQLQPELSLNRYLSYGQESALRQRVANTFKAFGLRTE